MYSQRTTLTKEQAKQESQYAFPYHYIVNFSNGYFSQTKNLSWGYEYLSYLHFVVDTLSHMKFASLLDVGCGDGRFLHELRKRFPQADLVGIDFSEKAIFLARAFNQDISFVVGDVTDKKSFHRKFDIITTIEVLEHIPSERLEAFLEALHHDLQEDGVLVITVPSKNVRIRSKHYQHFDMEDLSRILRPYFEILERHFLNKIGLMTGIIRRVLSNKLFLLNSKFLLMRIFNYYRKNMLIAKETNAKRICLVCKKKR